MFEEGRGGGFGENSSRFFLRFGRPRTLVSTGVALAWQMEGYF
jgi:hypothetical protein